MTSRILPQPPMAGKEKKGVIKLFQLITQIGKPLWDLKSNYSRLLKSVTSRSASPGVAPIDLILINYEDLASFSCLPRVLWKPCFNQKLGGVSWRKNKVIQCFHGTRRTRLQRKSIFPIKYFFKLMLKLMS